MLARSPYEVGMMTPYEVCVSVWYNVGVGSTGIVTGVFSLLMRLCVCGAKRI